MKRYDEPSTTDVTDKGNSHIPQGQIILAHFDGFHEDGGIKVSFLFAGSKYNEVGMSTAPLSDKEIGRQVAISFIDSDIHKPIVMGVVYSPLYDYLTQLELTSVGTSTESNGEVKEPDKTLKPNHKIIESTDAADPNPTKNTRKSSSSPYDSPVVVDGKKVRIEGSEQIELRCGESSITLTKEGRILIRGKYLLNRASGVNRIVGGSVQVN